MVSSDAYFQEGRAKLEFAIDAEYFVPEKIEITNGTLFWDWTGKERPVPHFAGLLGGFVRIHQSPTPERAVLDFARRWGILMPCAIHKRPEDARDPSDLLCAKKADPRGHPEGLDLWLAMSRQLDGTIRIAYDLATGRPGGIEGWRLFYNGMPKVFGVGETVLSDRESLLEHLNGSMFSAMVRPQIRWRNEHYSIDFLVESLHAALIAQTTFVVARQGIAICANCGHLFAPKQLKPGCDTYCGGPHCGRKAAGRAAQKRRYNKSRRLTNV